MGNGIRKRQAISLLVCMLLFSVDSLASVVWAALPTVCRITATEAVVNGDEAKYILTGSTTPPYSVTERFAPFRVEVISGAKFTEPPQAMPKNGFVKMAVEELQDDAVSGKRFIFTLADSHDYDVRQSGNKVIIAFTPAKGVRSQSAVSFGNKKMKDVLSVKQAAAATLPPSGGLYDFQVTSMLKRTAVTIRADRQIEDYSVGKIAEPKTVPRMYIDIAEININGLPREKVVADGLLSRIRVVPKGDGARIIFDSATEELFAYSVTPSADGLDVILRSADTPLSSPAIPKRNKVVKTETRLDAQIRSSEKMAAKDPENIIAEAAANDLQEVKESFSLSGYQTKNITVDFYKIDIHNVFRLFREVTELNIIVDENVKGSLTLALNDVPWDFALDIVLNLMHLKKKEKFNTIVIYPADKDFIWPERVRDSLSIKPAELVVEKVDKQPAEILKARGLIQKARLQEKQNNLEDAILLYEKALALWPDNKRVSNRLAAIHLVELGMNAKARFYAEQSLKYHANDRSAALYAAIAFANMKRLSQANEYFTRAISDTPPKKEAVLSYAAFCENNGMNEAALKLLAKYEKYYGETVNTMVARARIFDKTGRRVQARSEYQAVLDSGYQLPPDLRSYIRQRVAEAQ